MAISAKTKWYAKEVLVGGFAALGSVFTGLWATWTAIVAASPSFLGIVFISLSTITSAFAFWILAVVGAVFGTKYWMRNRFRKDVIENS